jgi:CBS domain-containing protein
MIKKELIISDIMDDGIVSVTPETSLKDLIDLFSSKNLSYAPVIDSKGVFKGEVNLHDIIGAGLPEYINMIGNLGFLSTLEPFEDVLKKEDQIKVADIMKKPVLEVKPDTSIIELAFLLMKHKKRHAPVIDKGELLGIVSLTDILNKVLRAKLWI